MTTVHEYFSYPAYKCRKVIFSSFEFVVESSWIRSTGFSVKKNPAGYWASSNIRPQMVEPHPVFKFSFNFNRKSFWCHWIYYGVYFNTLNLMRIRFKLVKKLLVFNNRIYICSKRITRWWNPIWSPISSLTKV